MIQIIGFMMAGYIVMRALAIICSSESHWRSSGARLFMVLVAFIAIVGTGFMAIALLLAGAAGVSGIR